MIIRIIERAYAMTFIAIGCLAYGIHSIGERIAAGRVSRG